MELDPLSPAYNLALGAWFYFTRQYNEAIEQLKKTVELDPALSRPHEVLALSYADAGLIDLATAEQQTMSSLPGGELAGRPLLGYILVKAGQVNEARKILEELAPVLDENLLLFWRTTYLCAALNEFDLAFDLLEKLSAQRFGLLVYTKCYPALDNLHGDPRYAELLSRIGLPE